VFAVQYNDIQRSVDTPSIRGFPYCDASRGMNLGEDMAGTKSNAGVVDRERVLALELAGNNRVRRRLAFR
jgi:hypothetical protein